MAGCGDRCAAQTGTFRAGVTDVVDTVISLGCEKAA